MARRTSNRKARVNGERRLDGSDISSSRQKPRRKQAVRLLSSPSSTTATKDEDVSLLETTSTGTAIPANAVTEGKSTISKSRTDSFRKQQNGDHPPDCQCYLRKLKKSLFLPPSLMELDEEDKDGGTRR